VYAARLLVSLSLLVLLSMAASGTEAAGERISQQVVIIERHQRTWLNLTHGGKPSPQILAFLVLIGQLAMKTTLLLVPLKSLNFFVSGIYFCWLTIVIIVV
jgi:hypothetical protein